MIHQIQPNIILGTAMWGWTTPRKECFALLDQFYQQGFREVDAATNYPINKIPEDFRKGEKILLEWIQTHGVQDLQVMIKVGSIDNMRSPEHNLSRSFLLMNLDDYLHRFDKNLDTFMIHWDNRADKDQIKESLMALASAQAKGLQVGLSGIKHPELYRELNESFRFRFQIQIKHNLLYSDLPRYAPLHDMGAFIAYGINAGGLKLEDTRYTKGSSLRARGGDPDTPPPILADIRTLIKAFNQSSDLPPILNFNQCGMTFAFYEKGIEGILIGTSRVKQLKESIRFYEDLKNNDYSDLYQKLKIIHQQHA